MVIENKTAYKSKTRWTAIDLERAIHLKNQGVTHQVIAESLGRSVKSVDLKLHKWARSMKEASDNAIALANEEPFDIAALLEDKPKRAKPKHYLRHVAFENKEDAKAMGALWDGMCWFIPDGVTGDAREALAAKYGPVCYGNHSARGKGQWDVFVFADDKPVEPKAVKPDAVPTPARPDVEAKPKAVTQKQVQPVVESKGTTGTHNTAVGSDAFTIRIPKRFVWGVLVSVLVAAAWYVGKTY